MKVYIDGAYYDKSEARISVYDHGFLYGDGIFEGIRIYNGKVFKLSAHLRRLYESAKAIALNIPMTFDELRLAVIETVRINSKIDGYIRLVVTRGKGALGIDPFLSERPSVIIIVDDIQLYPKEYYEKGIPIVTAATRRISQDVFDVRVKSLNYLNNILAKIEARNAGCLEAVMLNSMGLVAECTADNIFVIKDAIIMTPDPHHGALEGITLKTVIEVVSCIGLKTQFKALTRYDLYNADECFLTGTGAEIMPITMIDGRVIGKGSAGDITKRLIKAFREHIAVSED